MVICSLVQSYPYYSEALENRGGDSVEDLEGPQEHVCVTAYVALDEHRGIHVVLLHLRRCGMKSVHLMFGTLPRFGSRGQGIIRATFDIRIMTLDPERRGGWRLEDSR